MTKRKVVKIDVIISLDKAEGESAGIILNKTEGKTAPFFFNEKEEDFKTGDRVRYKQRKTGVAYGVTKV